MPNEAFFALSEEKQKEILSAALQEFSQNGYDLASTNNIVSIAKISKGLLFKYFSSKEQLFLFIVDKFRAEVETSAQNLYKFKDIFEYLEYSVQMDISKGINDKNARLFLQLLNRMHLEPNHPIYVKALSNYLSAVNRAIDDYCRDLDGSKLRDGLTQSDLRKILYFLTDSMRSVFNKNPNRLFEESEQVLKDVKMVFSIVRTGVFKS